jgi:hypothetical protein
MTPWEVIERRIKAAAVGDFVTAIYNPKSNGRYWQLYRLVELFLQQRSADTPVGYVRQAGRDDQAVKVTTLAGTGKAVVGEVVGLSSRIVPFPSRMWKMPEMPVYGREVTIKIPEDNPFLLGEMVTITETSVKHLKKDGKK